MLYTPVRPTEIRARFRQAAHPKSTRQDSCFDRAQRMCDQRFARASTAGLVHRSFLHAIQPAFV
jgi:hypothetical protein